MKLAKTIFLLILLLTIPIVNFFPQSKDSLLEIKANVLVVDANKLLINDVKQDDIKIFEDGIEQKITYFAKKEPVLNLGLIIDNTGSMRTQLEQLIWTSKIVSANLGANDQQFIVRFVSGDKIQVIQDWISPQGSMQNQTKVQRLLDNLFIEGGQSAVVDALYLSAKKMTEREKQNKSQKYALLLISDGEDRNSLHTYKELIDLLKDSEIQIYTLAFIGELDSREGYINKNPREKSIEFLNKLSNDTNGIASLIEKANPKQDFITKALQPIVYELRSQYVIGYTSTNQKRGGKLRKLTVQIADNEKGEKRIGYIREGFIVPKK